MPPSTDDLPGRKPPERRAGRGGGRKPGKQPGAPGAYLAWSQDPDTIVDHFPQGRCTCGADLSGAADLGVRYSHQVTDLPDARALTVQHDRHEARCGCGRVHVAGAPPEATGAPGTVTYGLNFQAWCVFLMVMHQVPVERCADIIESISLGPSMTLSDGYDPGERAPTRRSVRFSDTSLDGGSPRIGIILDVSGPL
jgi:transposase